RCRRGTPRRPVGCAARRAVRSGREGRARLRLPGAEAERALMAAPARAERYLAFDLGAESGRAMCAAFDGARMSLEEVHRFPNGPVRVPLAPSADLPAAPREALYWDALALWREIKAGMAAFRDRFGAPASIGIDTWGVDYAL